MEWANVMGSLILWYISFFLSFLFIRSDSYFVGCLALLCSVSEKAQCCCSSSLFSLSFFSLRFMKIFRLRVASDCAECIIVETVKSLTGRDTIYIYGFRFTMLHLILMQNTSTRTHTHTHIQCEWVCERWTTEMRLGHNFKSFDKWMNKKKATV